MVQERGTPYHELRRHQARRYRSIITDIFDGALVSSVKCLTCDTVSKTAETFQVRADFNYRLRGSSCYFNFLICCAGPLAADPFPRGRG